MKVVGKTIEGKLVVSKISKFYFEQGLPLVFVFDKLQENNFVVSWIHLYNELIIQGMSHKRILSMLNEQIVDSYGKEYRNVVIAKLRALYE